MRFQVRREVCVDLAVLFALHTGESEVVKPIYIVGLQRYVLLIVVDGFLVVLPEALIEFAQKPVRRGISRINPDRPPGLASSAPGVKEGIESSTRALHINQSETYIGIGTVYIQLFSRFEGLFGSLEVPIFEVGVAKPRAKGGILRIGLNQPGKGDDRIAGRAFEHLLFSPGKQSVLLDFGKHHLLRRFGRLLLFCFIPGRNGRYENRNPYPHQKDPIAGKFVPVSPVS